MKEWTDVVEFPQEQRSMPWGDYTANSYYSINAQIVMDVIAAARLEMRRMPPLMRVRIQSGLTSDEVRDAIAELVRQGWTAAEFYAKNYPGIKPRAVAIVKKPMAKRKPVSGDLRAMVWNKSGGVCWYCGVQTNPFIDFHVDHFIPVADGGTNDPQNLVPSCQRCNGEKGAMHVESFRAKRGGCIFWFERGERGRR